MAASVSLSASHAAAIARELALDDDDDASRDAPRAASGRRLQKRVGALCEQLVEWYRKECDDEGFDFNGIAVTRNFVGSPHIDRFDTGLQLAVSLGDFTGGELCVEAAEDDAIEVVDTRGRIAKVDGRKVHWVRAFTGGERFSLIFYTAAPASASVS